MSRLCRLKSYKDIGDDGKWAYDEIVKLRQQRDELKEALASKVIQAVATQQWLGVGAMIFSLVTESGHVIELKRIPYQPGGVQAEELAALTKMEGK